VLDITPDLSRLWVVYQQACRYSPQHEFGEIRINEPVGPGTFLAPSQISWPTQYMGATVRSVPVTVINPGTDTVVVSGAAIDGPAASDYAVNTVGACTTLAPGGACTLDVAFNPHQFGDRTATLTVDDSTGTHTAGLMGPVGPTSTVSLFGETSPSTSGTLWRTGPDRIEVAGSPNGRVAVTLTRGGSTSQSYLAFNPPTGGA
jgi:hypothetical protein